MKVFRREQTESRPKNSDFPTLHRIYNFPFVETFVSFD